MVSPTNRAPNEFWLLVLLILSDFLPVNSDKPLLMLSVTWQKLKEANLETVFDMLY